MKSKIRKLRKFRTLFLVLIFLLVTSTGIFYILLHPQTAKAQWYDGGWTYRKRINILNARVTDKHTNFPLLVSYTDVDIKNNAQTDGDDILFTASDGSTKLNHVLESYNSSTGEVIAWVQLPRLRDDDDTNLYIYYGNQSVSSMASSANVWDSNYRGVYHLSDGSGTNAADQTSNSNDLTLNTASWLSSGKVAGAWNGDGSKWLSRNDDDDFDFAAANNFTISAWVKSDSATNPSATQWVLNKSLSGGTQNPGYAIYYKTSGVVCFGIDDDNTWSPDDEACSSSDVYDGNWHYLTAVKTGTTRIEIFVDGVSVGSDTSISATGTLANSRVLYLGDRQGSDGTDEFAGDIDEFRVASTNRSSNWILTEYNNQSSPATFLTVSGTQEQMATILNWKFDEGYGTTVSDSTDRRLDGTLGASTASPDRRSEDLCLFGKCLLFDGVDDYISRTYSSSTDSGLDPGTDGFAVSMWFRHGNVISANETLISRYNNGGYDLYMNTSGQICFRVAQNGTALASGDNLCTTKTFYDNNWYFVKAIWDPDSTNKQSIYISSSLEASSNSITQSGSKSGSSPTLYIGVSSTGSSNYWYGYIDDVKIYREDSSDAKMRADTASANYTEGASAVFGAKDVRESLTNGLVGYWRFEETSEGTCPGNVLDSCDLSGASNHAEWGGTPTSTPAKFGRGLKFDTNDDYLSVSDSSALDISSRFTISSWVKPLDDSSPPLLIQKDGSTTTSTQQSSNNISFSHTVNTQSNQVLVVTSGIEDDGSTAISSITFNGQNLTSAVATSNTNRRAEIWYLLNPPVGTYTLTVQYAATVNDIIVGATNIYNVAQQAPTQTATNINDSAPTTVTFTPSNDMSAVIESVVNGTPTSNNLNPTSGQTELYDTSSSSAKASANFTIVEENVSTSFTVGADTIDNQAHVAAVFAPVSSSSTRVLLGKGRDAYQIELTSGNTLNVYFYSTNILTTTLTNDAWSHLLVSYDSVNATLYVNGELIQSVAVNRATSTNNTNLTIGQSFDGIIDDLRLYNRPFSEYEVRYFYEWGPAPLTYYTFDEGTGTTVNNKGYSTNGATLTCTGVGCSNPTWAPGRYGKSLQFSKTTNGYVALDSPGITVDTREPFSLSMWVYPDDIINAQYDMLLCDNNINNGFCMYLYGTSTTAAKVDLCVDNSTCTSNPDTNNSVVTEKKWSHIEVTYDGANNYLMYIDGIDQSLDLNAPSISDITSQNFLIGMYDPSGTPDGCNCRIDDLRIYNYTRTQKQVISDLNINHPPIGGSVGGPVAYWNFDEGRNTSVYSQGNCVSVCNASTSNFSDPPTTSSGWTAEGRYDKALRFDGTNDYINIGNDYQLRIPSQITLSAWVKPESNNRTIISKWDTPSTRSYRLHINSSNQIEFGLSNNGTTESILTSNDTLSVDGSTWYHIVATYDGSTMKLFIDGQADNTLARTGSIYEGSENVIIGGSYQNNSLGSYFDGVMDEVRIYNYALNDSETGQEYFKGATALIGTTSTESDAITPADSADRSYCVPGDSSTCSAPKTYLKLNEKSGTTANDDSGFSNNGSHTGGSAAFFAKALFNNGLTFSNNNATRIQMDQESQYDFTSQFSMMGWWKINSWQNSNSRLMAKGTSAYYLRRNGSTGALSFYTQGLSDNTLDSTTDISDGNWHHIAAVWDGSTKYLYIDGQIDAYETATGTMNTNNSNVTIGEDSNTGSGTFSAQVDEVKIYDYARTTQQINWDMNRGKPASWWKFDECNGNTAYDAGVNAAHATISIGGTGTYTTATSCNSGSTSDALYVGRNGIFNSAIALDGSNDKVITTNAATVANFNQVTLSAWVYPTSYNASGAKIYFEPTNTSSSNARMELVLNSNGTVSFQGRAPDADSLTTWVTTSKTVSLNQWSHVVGIFDSVSDNHYIYINKFQTTASVSEASFSNSNPAVVPYIGAISSGVETYNFTGFIDDVRIYPYAMTQLQVNLLNSGDGAAVFGPSSGLP